MTTILPIDLDDEFIQDALTHAVGKEIESAAKLLTEMAADLKAGGVVDRGRLSRAFAHVAELNERVTPVLEFARGFADQWRDDAEEARSADAL